MLWLMLACTPDNDTGDTAPQDTAAWDTGVTPAEGLFCDPAEQIGQIMIQRWGSDGTPTFDGRIWDQSDPWIDQPTLEEEPCAFYEWSGCEDCPSRSALQAVATINGVEYPSDEATGMMWGEVSSDVFEMSVRFAGGTATAEPLNLLSGLNPTVTSTGDSDQPGDLEVSWTGADSGHVATWIPINHHANPYTWTQCMVEADAAGFTVPEDMVTPLAVSTGLEFQGVWHGEYLAAETDAGCIQFSVQTQYFTGVDFN